MRNWARASLCVSLVSATLALGGCGTTYLLKQANGQIGMLLKRESIGDAMKDGRLTDEQKGRIELVQAAKTYAIKSLGLKKTGSYDMVVPLDRSAVTYVVSGAPKDALVPYLWSFPIVGAVPYKGFFDKNDALAEQKGLADRGYDTSMRGVAAFSLLGILPDPLYSPLLKYRPAVLSNIIIHELTHGTVFLKGEARFNEGFATFVGNQGSLMFLRDRFGPKSEEAVYAEGYLRDEQRFTSFLNDLSAELRALYASPLTREEKVVRRENVFTEARARFALIPFETDYYTYFPKATLNNAFLITLLTYQSNLNRFDQVYEREGKDLAKMIRFFKDEVAKQPEPEQYLDSWLSKQAGGR